MGAIHPGFPKKSSFEKFKLRCLDFPNGWIGKLVVPLRKGRRKIANHWMSMAAKHPEMDYYSLPFMK
jgi:hypothetical protein